MLHLETTGVRWSGFTKSKWLGVKIDKVYELVLNTKSCLKIKSKTILQLSRAGCRHSADGEESWRRGCAVSITCQGICPCPAQLAWPASACPRTSQSSPPNSSKPGICCSVLSHFPSPNVNLILQGTRKNFQVYGNHCTMPGSEPRERGAKNFVMQRHWDGQSTSKRALSISAVLPASNTGSSPLTAE